MPEIGEVATFADDLNGLLKDKVLVGYRYTNDFKHYRNIDKIKKSKLIKVFNRGKKIIFEFETGFFMSSLGLEGSWYLGHDRGSTILCFLFAREIDNYLMIEDEIGYQDTRHGGWLEWFDTWEELENRLEIGYDLLRSPPTLTQWKEVFQNPKFKNKVVCEFLLEQKYFAGIGNYLRAMCLYLARIHPERKLSSLTEEEIERLYERTIETVRKSYQERGASLRTYKDLFGRKGNFEVLIYGQRTDPNGNLVESFYDKDRRRVWFVPNVQI